MPYAATPDIPARTWVCLTPNGAVATLRLQCQGPYDGHLVANQSTTVPPASIVGSVMLNRTDMITTEMLVATYFPADVVAGAAVIWIYSEQKTSVSVQHA